MHRILLAFAFTAMMTAFAPPVRAAGACGCADLEQIVLRLEEDSVSISRFMAEMSAARLAAAQGRAPEPYSVSAYLTLRDAVIGQLTTVFENSGVDEQKFGNSKTELNCKTKVDAQTACMQAAMQAHEDYHAQMCREAVARAEANGETLGPGNMFLKRWDTMAEYSAEEAAGYYTEQAFLLNEIVRLMSSGACTPPDPPQARAYTADEEGEPL
jgi:hypothetical protein